MNNIFIYVYIYLHLLCKYYFFIGKYSIFMIYVSCMYSDYIVVSICNRQILYKNRYLKIIYYSLLSMQILYN